MTDGQSSACRDQIETSGGVCRMCCGRGTIAFIKSDGAWAYRPCQCGVATIDASVSPAYITAAQAREIAENVFLDRPVTWLEKDQVRAIAREEAAKLLQEEITSWVDDSDFAKPSSQQLASEERLRKMLDGQIHLNQELQMAVHLHCKGQQVDESTDRCPTSARRLNGDLESTRALVSRVEEQSEQIGKLKTDIADLEGQVAELSRYDWRRIDCVRQPASAEEMAERFHEAYERLAPNFDYKTRDRSAVPWDQVPDNNRRLMIAVCKELFPQQPGVDTATALQTERELRLQLAETFRKLADAENANADLHRQMFACRALTDEQLERARELADTRLLPVPSDPVYRVTIEWIDKAGLLLREICEQEAGDE